MDQKLNQQIMGRVYTAYYLRQYGYSMVNLGIFVVASVALYFSVSWKNVFANMPNLADLNASYNFFSSAVLNTEIAVQISLIAVALVLISYAVSLVRKNDQKLVRQNI